jgi:hypothetical protein
MDRTEHEKGQVDTQKVSKSQGGHIQARAWVGIHKRGTLRYKTSECKQGGQQVQEWVRIKEGAGGSEGGGT